jgi:hypothetical protein
LNADGYQVREGALKTALYIAALLLISVAPGPLAAQPFYAPYGSMPPHEALAVVRSKGLDPVSRPVRQGPVYVLRALNPAGQEVRVLVDATVGRVVKVVPVAPNDPGAFAPPAAIPSVRTVPEGGTGPYPHTAVVPPGGDDDFEPLYPPPASAAPKPPARTAAKPATPLPKPRPKEAAAATATAATAAPEPTTPAAASVPERPTAPAAASEQARSTGVSTGASASAENTAPPFLELDE